MKVLFTFFFLIFLWFGPFFWFPGKFEHKSVQFWLSAIIKEYYFCADKVLIVFSSPFFEYHIFTHQEVSFFFFISSITSSVLQLVVLDPFKIYLLKLNEIVLIYFFMFNTYLQVFPGNQKKGLKGKK